MKNVCTIRECLSDAYPMQKVEKFINRLGGANFITMLDPSTLESFGDIH